jgi:hypothetical protein
LSVHTALPALIALDNGVVASVQGRPGVTLRFSNDPDCRNWSHPHVVHPAIGLHYENTGWRDSVADITTLALEDETNYYLIVSNNSGTFSDVTLRLKGLKLATTHSRPVQALNESWSRTLAYSEDAGEWVLDPHTMCFGDINVWVIPKAPPAE